MNPEVAVPARLTFRHWQSFSREFVAEIAITERLSKKRSITFTYAVKVVPPLPVCRVFHFYKQGEVEQPRELRVYSDGHTCTCESGKYRPGKPCRHLEAIQFLITEGVLS